MLSFLGIGAQKAGTSWLYEHLRRHPEIHFPVGKENHYWDGLERGKRDESIAEYAQKFTGSSKGIYGEITPAYATLRSETIARIYAEFPDLKLLFSVRDPVARAWSAARMFMDAAWLTCDDVDEGFLWQLCSSNAFTQRGDYASCLRKWLEHFPADQILVIDYASILEDPEKVLARVIAHLGISQSKGWPHSQKLRTKVRQGVEWKMPSNLGDRLAAHYTGHVGAFEELLKKHFPQTEISCQSWLSQF